ncbi:MAG: bifunctional tetrahydrofolate synthase/dihydrofolate synthase [Planctomycetaceae bacterium]
MNHTVNSYQEAMDFLHGRINYERAAGEKLTSRHFKLDRMRKFLSLLKHPESRSPAVHVAGTKGKGSTCVMIADMLSASGYSAGLFTSPHINAFEERMRVNGVSPTHAECVMLVNQLIPVIEQLDAESSATRPTYFEIATAMAWLFFQSKNTQLNVLEVGLGGRLDSTNVCHPELTIITNISRDHTHLLGDTPAEIAREKAGILKPGIPVICGVANPEAKAEIERIARKKNCEIIQLGRDIQYRYQAPTTRGGLPGTVDVETPFRKHDSVGLPLAGKHQAANAALAITAIDWMAANGHTIPENAIAIGMSSVRWPLRMERLQKSPTVIVDAAHNESSVVALCNALREEVSANRRILLFSVCKDKDVEAMARALYPHFDEVVLTSFVGNPRAMPAKMLYDRTKHYLTGSAHVTGNPEHAWEKARALSKETDVICVTGSFFLAAEFRNLFRSTEKISSDNPSESIPPEVVLDCPQSTIQP